LEKEKGWNLNELLEAVLIMVTVHKISTINEAVGISYTVNTENYNNDTTQIIEECDKTINPLLKNLDITSNSTFFNDSFKSKLGTSSFKSRPDWQSEIKVIEDEGYFVDNESVCCDGKDIMKEQEPKEPLNKLNYSMDLCVDEEFECDPKFDIHICSNHNKFAEFDVEKHEYISSLVKYK
jgi:hypothetical protein